MRERRRAYQRQRKAKAAGSITGTDEPLPLDFDDQPPDWRDELLEQLRALSPAAFERLCMALLRAAGFADVEVTGKSGDGGIDGIGVYRPQGLISFHTAVQCKRYQGSVGTAAVREFRGSFVGKADRGVIMTTGSFTRSAEEAAAEMTFPVDLLDGDGFCDLLKEFELGVSTITRQVEDVFVDYEALQSYEDH